MSNFILILPIIELLIGVTGFAFFWRTKNYSIPESICFSIFTFLTLISIIYQSVFLLGNDGAAIPLECLVIISSCLYVGKNGFIVKDWMTGAWNWVRRHPASFGVLFAGWIYLFLQALLLPPSSYDSMTYHLPRILLFQQEQTVFLKTYTNPLQVCSPIGHDIIYHMFLRWHTDFGIGLISFLEYLGAGFGIFAMVRKFAGASPAWASAILAWSLPLIVYQATSTKNDLMTAFAAIVCMNAAMRLVNDLTFKDLSLLITALCMGLASKWTFASFIIPFVLIFAPYLILQHSASSWKKIIIHHWRGWTLLLPPLLVLSQIWLLTYNYFRFGHLLSPADLAEGYRNSDGLLGGSANLIRYLFQSCHPLQLTEDIFLHATGISLQEMWYSVYEHYVLPWAGTAGCYGGGAKAFALNWNSSELTSWFGPMGFFVLLPAAVYTAWKGAKALKAMIFVIFGYAVVASMQMGWVIYNGRFFSLFFMLSCVCAGFALSRMKRAATACAVLQTFSLLLFIYACLFNSSKPLLTENKVCRAIWGRSAVEMNKQPMNEENIWEETNWGSNRLYFADKYYRDDRIKAFKLSVRPGSRVGILCRYNISWVYHFLMNRPDVEFAPIYHWMIQDGIVKRKTVDGLDYLLTLDAHCREISGMKNLKVLWRNAIQTQPASLIDLRNQDSSGG